MQLRFECSLTGADDITQQGWLDASLPCCPLHPRGGCGFARDVTYARVSPPGTQVARWYCPTGHRTFSLLPDCLAARLCGSLQDVETLVRAAEQASSLEALCARERVDIELPGALRRVRRRGQDVHSALHLIKGLSGEAFVLVEPTVTAFAAHLGVEAVLVALRGIAAAWLGDLPKPLGFAPRRSRACPHHPRQPSSVMANGGAGTARARGRSHQCRGRRVAGSTVNFRFGRLRPL